MESSKPMFTTSTEINRDNKQAKYKVSIQSQLLFYPAMKIRKQSYIIFNSTKMMKLLSENLIKNVKITFQESMKYY